MTRRALPFGLALAALLGVVAAATTAVADGGRASGGGSVSPAVAAYVYAALVVVAIVGIPLLVVLGIREVPEARRRSRRTWLTPLVLAVLAVAGVAVSARAGDGFRELFGRIRVVEPAAVEAESARPPAPEWVPLALASTVALGGALLFGRRRPSARRTAADLLADALDAPLADLRDEPDVRRAVVAAFARLERALEAAGLPRAPGEAPLEYVGRALSELDVPPGPPAELAVLFERAKFSRHELGEADREAAIEALDAVREALR